MYVIYAQPCYRESVTHTKPTMITDYSDDLHSSVCHHYKLATIERMYLDAQ